MERKEYARQYRERNRERLRLQRREWNKNHPELRRAGANRYGRKVKKEVLTHYGNGVLACVECGENRLPCLSIDHIQGDGAKHREILRGTRIYVWLRVNCYPKGYQTLCMNCQWVKRDENKEWET